MNETFMSMEYSYARTCYNGILLKLNGDNKEANLMLNVLINVMCRLEYGFNCLYH